MMLPTWLEDWLTPRTRSARALGYLRELNGIRARHHRWPSAWGPHLERTRQTILAGAERTARQRRAVVLGSGWLLDVPLDELATRFQEVVLVDVVHPRRVRRRVRALANVRLLEADITATAEALLRVAGDPEAALPTSRPALFLDDPEVDLLASVNLLSQLPCMPEQYLLRRRSHAPDKVSFWAREVILSHLEYLRKFRGVVALVADVEEQTLTASGEVVRTCSTLYGLQWTGGGESWSWPLIPRKPEPPHHTVLLRVVGIPDLNGALALAEGAVGSVGVGR